MPVVQAHAAEGHSDSGGGATCAGGAVAPGTYASLTITGVCIIPKGKVVVRHNLVVGRNAALDTLTPATVIVWGDFVVEPGAEAILGCSPGIGCDFTTHDVIHGNVRIYQPLAAIFHSDTIYGHVSFQGGGGGVTCANQLPGGPPMTPVYSDFEGNVIAGEVNVSGLGSCWFGFIRNHVRSSVILNDNIMADPDANEVVSNVIRGNLVCSGNAPAPQVGDSFGGPNTVRGHEEGQCVGL
ncbi:MAG: hypothetical protein ACRDHE_11490 [Ktedonobacterales bacterium]